MKAYGKYRDDSANRKIRGTSRDCPCCIPGMRRYTGWKKRARREGKIQAAERD